MIVTLLIFNCNCNSRKPETKSWTFKKRFEVILKSLISFLKCILKSIYIHIHIYTHTHVDYIYTLISLLSSFMRLYVINGCIKIQINDQWREFVNEISKILHKMVSTVPHITSAYHPQSNGLCEWQNGAIKDSLVKVLDGNPCDGFVIKGLLFAQRASKHTLTKFLPFFLMYIENLPYQSMSSIV